MCVSCREMKPQNELVRIVRQGDGAAEIDTKGRQDGRGAYLCPNEACIKKAQREKRLERALRTKIEGEIYDKLGEMYA